MQRYGNYHARKGRCTYQGEYIRYALRDMIKIQMSDDLDLWEGIPRTQEILQINRS